MKKIISAILIFICLFTSTFAFYEDFDFENDEEFYLETATSTGVPTLNARAAILYDATFDRILYEKNARQKRANAALPKPEEIGYNKMERRPGARDRRAAADCEEKMI